MFSINWAIIRASGFSPPIDPVIFTHPTEWSETTLEDDTMSLLSELGQNELNKDTSFKVL